MPTYLGIDGGGTKTEAVLISHDGKELARGRGGPCNILSQPDNVLRQSVSEALSELSKLHSLDEAASICAGVAGFSSEPRREAFRSMLEELVSPDPVRLEPDYVTAYWGASLGAPGIIVSVGTGCVAYGRDQHGNALRVGGRGLLIGDEGSGAYMGREALTRLATFMDNGILDDKLNTEILQFIGTSSVDGVTTWLYEGSTAQKLASLVPLILSASRKRRGTREQDDAKHIVHHSAECVATAAYRVYRQLSLPTEDWAVWAVGGLLEDKGYASLVSQKISDVGAVMHSPANNSAYGAALLAREFLR